MREWEVCSGRVEFVVELGTVVLEEAVLLRRTIHEER
jgi:hypothetical protein